MSFLDPRSALTPTRIKWGICILILGGFFFLTHRSAYLAGRDSERNSFQYVTDIHSATDNQARLATLRTCFRVFNRLSGSAKDQDVQKLLRQAREAIQFEETNGPDLIHKLHESERKVRQVDPQDEENALEYSKKLIKDLRELISKLQ